MHTQDFIIHAMYGTGRRYTATAPRQINRHRGGNPWGKSYLINWPYVNYHKKFDVLFPDGSKWSDPIESEE